MCAAEAAAEPADRGERRCAFCGAVDVELVSSFGSQIITSQWRCRACGSYFEAVRDDFAADAERG